jgi:hypothetical protein
MSLLSLYSIDIVTTLAPEPTVQQSVLKVITYILSMTSASEAKKSAAKRATKHATCQVQTDKPWSTV